jgi:hypothetical protein
MISPPSCERGPHPFDEFKPELDSYFMHWNTQRRQQQLNGHAPIEYRGMTLTA